MPKSPVAWLTDRAYALSPFSERLVAWGDSQVGVREEPKGSNWGASVSQYLAAADVHSPAPWCSSFNKWCATKAGAPSWILAKVDAMASSWYRFAVKYGRLVKTPKRGRIFVFVRSDGTGHTGPVISSLFGLLFRTIEGNSNDDGSSEGYEVVKRWRTMRSLKKWPHWGFVDFTGVQ